MVRWWGARPDDVVPGKRSESGGRPGLRVMTLNVAHGRRNGPHQLLQRRARIESNVDDIAAVLKRESPDIVALQEADGPSFWSGRFDHVRHLAQRAGFPHAVRGEHARALKVCYGTALLSTLPLVHPVSVTFPPVPLTFPKGYVVSTITWPNDGGLQVDVVSVHLDFVRAFVRKRQAAEMISRLRQRGRPLIVMGDFNCEWTSREPTLRTLASRLGLRAYRPEAAGLRTFRRVRRRLDWVLVSRDFEFVTYGALPDHISDHLGVVSELRLARGAG